MKYVEFDQSKPLDVIPIGRVAIDFNPTDMNRPLSESCNFNKYVGGSPANIAVGLARLGKKVGFIGKVSDDQHGDFVVDYFKKDGIDTSNIFRAKNGEKIGLTFTEIKSPTESSILMYRDCIADLMLEPEEVSEEYIASAKAIVISGTALCASPSREAALKTLFLAKKNGVPFFSTSALRYGEELDAVEAPTTVITTGGGSSAEEYIIHQVEMVVKKIGIGAKSVRATAVGGATCFHIRYDDGRAAQMTYSSGSLGFTAYMMNDTASKFRKIESDFFKTLMKDILVFFETGKISFDTAETHEAMKIREAALEAMATPDTWVEV